MTRICFHPSNIKIDLSDNPSIKYDIFEVTATFPPGVTNIGIVAQYLEHNNMSYIFQSKNNRPWNRALPEINRTNVWILRIGRKEPTTVQQAM